MSTKSAATRDETLVSGVNVSLVKIELVNKALTGLNVDIKDMSASDKVEALQFHGKKLSKAEKATCAECGGIAALTFPECPFCGDEGEDEDEKEDKGKGAVVTPIASAKKKKVVEGKKKTSTSTAIVKAGAQQTGLLQGEFSEKALDEANAEIEEIKQRAKHTYWELGNALLKVYEKELWKARGLDKGRATYTGFNQYIEAEPKISHTTAYNMMEVAKYFTEAQVKKIGGSKLSLVLKAPEADRPALMKEVEKGATSKRKLAKKVKEARKKAKLVKRQIAGRKAIPMNKREQAAAAGKGSMTIALVEGTKTLELWAKPDKPLKAGEKPTKRAKTLADEPWCLEPMANGAERIYSLVKTSKGLAFRATTRRK